MPPDIESEAERIVASLWSHRIQHGEFPSALEEAHPGKLQYRAWTYKAQDRGFGFELTAGDYGRCGWALFADRRAVWRSDIRTSEHEASALLLLESIDGYHAIHGRYPDRLPPPASELHARAAERWSYELVQSSEVRLTLRHDREGAEIIALTLTDLGPALDR